jgi:hypothetical protein
MTSLDNTFLAREPQLPHGVLRAEADHLVLCEDYARIRRRPRVVQQEKGDPLCSTDVGGVSTK